MLVAKLAVNKAYVDIEVTNEMKYNSIFKSQFLLEYYTQKAVNFTNY